MAGELFFVVTNVFSFFHVATASIGAPQRLWNRRVVGQVVRTKHFFDVFCRFDGVIVRHAGEDVMHDVFVRNVMKDDATKKLSWAGPACSNLTSKCW